MAKKPETLFKEKVLSDLRQLPRTYAVKIQQVVIRGTPDILACVNGWFVALELKKGRGEKPEPLQVHELKKIKKAGGRSHVVHPGNWPEVLAKLRTLAFGPPTGP